MGKVITLEQFGPGATPETDGVSEIETVVTTSNRRVSLELLGPAGINSAGINYGLDNFGTDNDIDVHTTTRPDGITIKGKGGDDIITGHGITNNVSTNVPLTINLSGLAAALALPARAAVATVPLTYEDRGSI